MGHVADNDLKTLVKGIQSPKLRQQLSDVISHRVKRKIYCLNKPENQRPPDGKTTHRNDVPIGIEYFNGRVVPFEDENGHRWLRKYRDRLDGARGFGCFCGNSSIRAKEEEGVIPRGIPNKEQLQTVHERLQSKKDYPIRNGQQVVDGFMIELVGGAHGG